MILMGVVTMVISHGFPFGLMDLNDDSFVSPAEYLRSIDLGHRPEAGREDHCTEIFLLKDGLPIKVICEDG